jgi:hypothetical protein
VQGALVGFVFLGPLLLAAQGIVAWSAQHSVADDFISRQTLEERPFKSYERQVAKDPASIKKVTVYIDSNALDVEQTDGSFYTVKYEAGAENGVLNRLNSQNIDQEEDSDGETGDALASSLIDDSTGYQVASSLLFPAILGLVVALIYIPLQALRAGLLTRFFGTFGMALGASLILILPVALLALLIWTGYLGLLFVNRVPGGRPPSWDAGVAIPWPAPGEEPAPAPADPDAIEGQAIERPPEDGQEPSGPPAQTRSKKRKRKRRR